MAPIATEIAKPIALIGFMGAGKSTAARALAAELGLEALDSDRAIKERSGSSISELFSARGEEEFRRIESELVPKLLKPGKIVALGGGAVLNQSIVDKLQQCLTVYLEVEPEVAWRRVSRSDRPLARDRERFFDLLRERRALYEEVADVVVASPKRNTLRQLAVELATAAQVQPLKMVWAANASRDYPVYFGRAAIDKLATLLAGRRTFIVSDENVSQHYLGSVQDQLGAGAVGSYQLQPGEAAKTLTNAQAVLSAMAKAALSRHDLVVALGGGVVGDLAGFCAATYQRGIDCVQIPTSLVAQVDSAYGGKTGVDLPEAKNYVGAFHQPLMVVTDPDVLETLPPSEFAAGFAEVVKTALIAGGELWQRIRTGVVDEGVILGCLRTKLAVVREDELDRGRRATLNLGHTVAHAVESATGYQRYRHGEAVALGLLATLEISERKLKLDSAIKVRVAELLAAQKLPEKIEAVTVEEVIDGMLLDKKNRDGLINWVLLRAPGDLKVKQQVEAELVRDVLLGLMQ